MGPINVVVQDANNLTLEVTPTAETSIVLDRGVVGPVGMVWKGNWSSATAYNVNDAVYYAAGNASYICILANTNQVPTNTTYWQLLVSGAGDVTGAVSSTDNALARFDGTTGKLIQNSVGILSDAGALTGLTTVDTTNLEVASVKAQDGTAAFAIANTTGVVSIDDTKLTLQDNTDTTKKAQFELSGITTATTRTYTLPNLTGSLATIGTLTQTFSGATTFSNAFTLSSATAAIALGTSQTTGTLSLGGAAQTGAITLGQSTASQTTNIQAGAAASGSTKTINFGTGGLSGSTTTINIGTDVSGATSNTLVSGGLSASGNVGIGTTSPQAKTDISASAPILRLTSTNTTLADDQLAAGIQFYQSDVDAPAVGASIQAYGQGPFGQLNLRFATGANTERMRLDSFGNLGIGTTTPQSTLDVFGDLRLSNNGGAIIADNLQLQSNTANSGTNINVRPSGSGNFAGVECQNGNGGDFARFTFGVQSSNTGYISGDVGGSGFYGNFSLTLGGGTGGMYWTTQGDVGLGTTSPVNRSSFRGFTANAANGSFVTLQGNGTSYGEILADVNGVQVSSVAAKPLILKTNDTDRVTIDSVGSTYIELGNLWQYTPAPTSKAAVATLTAAELFTGILNTTGTTYTVTVPTGTNIDAFYPQVPAVNIGFDFYVINTATGTITFAVNTGVTALGALTIPTATSAQFRFRRTAANTYIMYRLR